MRARDSSNYFQEIGHSQLGGRAGWGNGNKQKSLVDSEQVNDVFQGVRETCSNLLSLAKRCWLQVTWP